MRLTGRVTEEAVPGDGRAPVASAVGGVEIPPRPRQRIDVTPYLLLLPATLFLLVFFVWPMLQALVLAVQSSAGAFTLDNVQKMVHDLNFADAFRNTVLLLIVI